MPRTGNSYRIGEVVRYRVIDARIWDLIRELDGDPLKAYLYVYAGPHSTPYGVLRLPDSYIATDLRWRRSRVVRALAALEVADLVWRDGDLLFIVHFLMANPPANLSVVTSWERAISSLPESRFFRMLHERARKWVYPVGLTWLASKLPEHSRVQVPVNAQPDSTPCPDGLLDGVPHSAGTQYSGTGSSNQKQGEGTSAARSASPPQAAPLAAPGEAGNGDGQGEGVRALVSDLVGKLGMPVEIGTIDKSKIEAQKKIIAEMEQKARGTEA